MHCRSANMPGQVNVFTNNSITNPDDKTEENMLRLRNLFKREKHELLNQSIGPKFNHNHLSLYTYKIFHPYDDESLKESIIAAYKQIYGNINPMESERSIEAERRLRNGDIPIREFIRILAKQNFYLDHFFENTSQTKAIKLSFIHILGRPLKNEKEFRNSIELINSIGFEAHLDSLIDSIEYEEIFGEDIVPYERFWNSQCGAKSATFINACSNRKGFASSDNVIKEQRSLIE